MNNEIVINKMDVLTMKLIHYFVTENNYNPIVLHGVTDEIWLENLDNPYKVVRIVMHYIHNDEQLSFDKFKVKQVVNKLKVKTLSRKMKVLNIYLDISPDVNLINDDKYEDVSLHKMSDLKKYSIMEVFPDIIDKTKHKENGLDLFAKITTEINDSNTSRAKKLDKIFSVKKPIITYGIIAICIFVFILMYIFGNGSNDITTLINFGANVDVLTISYHEYYRLFTCAFLHIGIIHLLINMYSLYVIGTQVENFFGKIKYIIIYIISAICASLFSLVFSHNTISAGASGAIFGLMGALLYFGYHYRIYLGNVLRSQIIPLIVTNLIIGFCLSGVDNAAHIGGLLGGLFTSMIVGVPEKKNKQDRINGIILLIIFIAFTLYMIFNSI